MMDSQVSKADFIKSFEAVMRMVTELKNANAREMSVMHKKMSEMTDKMQSDMSSGMTDSKKMTMDYCTKEMSKMTKEHEKAMARMSEKMAQIKDGLDGRDGKNGVDGKNGKDGQNGKDGEDGKDGKDGRSILGGFRASNATKFYKLTPNGSNKTFTVPKSVASILHCSDFPHVLYEGAGFTINATRTQIVLTTDNAPSEGSQLIYQYSSMFNT